MRVLAADKRLARILCQKFFDALHRWVHLTFHITRIVVTSVVEQPLVMNETGIIQTVEQTGHFIDVLAAVRLIATRPDQDRRMVFVTLVHRIGTVKHHRKPLRFVVRHDIGIVLRKLCHIPGTVRFQICLINHVNAILITEFINLRRIRVMAGTDPVDVILLHRAKILAQLFLRHMPSADGTELVAVHALKDDPPSV